MKKLIPILLFALAIAMAASAQLKAPDAEQFVGPPKGLPVTGDQLDQSEHEIASELRCPVCQGLSIADSPAEMAINMKGQVRELLARGYTKEQILSYFEHSYGQFVLLKPKFRGVNSLVWTLPILALIAGALLVIVKLNKLQDDVAPPPAAEDDEYIARVRDLVNK